ncbi:patatin-like protein 2 [Pyrus ussuriensis x Pyrus communis]|uniref:Patatin-like protein 2 n=1 Tax=Pyrus ussuriensis x Pyrus communis TaxID=2448454 RepID=A0A5N5FUV6_9ROSA|nr:patatin-like protein 2 [Pyrus ussuriensis x Pyrus communis]
MLQVGNPNEWGILNWFMNSKRSGIPLIDVLTTPNVNMVEVYLPTFFNVSRSDGNYLRIQEDGLKPDEIDTTNSSPENLKKLVKAGTNLLEKTVSAMNLDTGWYDEPNDMTCKYKDAIAE